MQKMKDKKRQSILKEIKELIRDEIHEYKSSSALVKNISDTSIKIEKGIKKILDKY